MTITKDDSNCNQIKEDDCNAVGSKATPDLESGAVDEHHSGCHRGKDEDGMDMLYLVDDKPPWYVCLVLGFQQFLTMFSGAVALPLLMGPLLCMSGNDPARGYLAGTVLVMTGVSTLLQVIFGVRLPVIQGPSWTYYPPILAIMKLPEWQCPSDGNLEAAADGTPLWQPRLAVISGAVLVASIFQTLLGFSGAVGLITKYLSPITILCTIIVLGIGFFESFQIMAAQNWPIALLTTTLVIISSQYLRNRSIKIRRRNKKTIKIYLFKLFPILFGLLIGWSVSAVLTVTDIIAPGSPARTDAKIQMVYDAAWIRVPWPGQWGLPTISAGAVLGMMAAVISSTVESIGDYFACAQICGAPPPPLHAINRGIGIEGMGGVIHNMFGTGMAATTYSGNIGALGVTKVGSRRVILCAAGFMILFGLTTKFGALFLTIPDPVYVGAFIPLFAMITGMGFSMLQKINLGSSRNMFIIGFSILFSLVLPTYVSRNPATIQTGNNTVDQVVFVLLSTSIFVAGIVAFLLDNTVPGDERDRGVTAWREQLQQTGAISGETSEIYNIPFSSYLNKLKCTRWLPFLPGFKGFPSSSRAKSATETSGRTGNSTV